MKKILTPVLFFAALHLSTAQVDLDVPNRARNDQDVPSNARAQVITQDLVVQGSECVGVDCPSSPSFGFNTIELRENNLRLKFFDTSNSASFPSNDWTLEANESSNGGSNHFAIVDDGTGRRPFFVEAGADNKNLVIEADGDVGIKTADPVVDLHITEGNTPTVRLAQDGSDGFTPQTWDVAGNEANFFIRDVTNGSKLPFKIKPNAPTGSMFIAASGNVGLGTESPDAKLEVNGDLKVSGTDDQLMLVSKAGTNLSVLESTDGGAVQLRLRSNSNNNRRILAMDNSDVIHSQINMKDGGVFDFYGEVAGVFTTLTAGNSGLTASSSRSLKSNINEVEIPDILDRIAEVPVTTYNWRRDLVSAENARREVLGLIAQDFYTVLQRGKDTEINSQDVQMALWLAVQRLHETNKEQEEELETRDEKISELEGKIEDLTARLDEISELLSANQQGILLNGGERPVIGQNFPNPYEESTTIEYFLPENSEAAEVHFFDNAGKLIKAVPITQSGKGQLVIEARELPVGTYQYSLVVGDQHIDTKRMILSR